MHNLMATKKLFAILALLVLVGGIFAFQTNVKNVEAQQKGPASDTIILKQITNDQQAMAQVDLGGDQGGTDIHFFRAPPAQITELLTDPNIVVVFNKRGGYLSLILNPVPMSETGKFNPFEYREFREGLQYIVERQKIVTDINKGYSIPWLVPISWFDYDWLYVADNVEKLGIKDDVNYGYQLMADALTKAGAVKVGGKWTYNGVPISITIFIRSDDPVRLLIGEDLATKLSNFGLTVNKIYGDLLKAFDVVYGSDPRALGWHIYTEGWGQTALTKYQDSATYQFYASPLGFMPGWAEPTFWNYANKTIDDLTTRLVTGNFTSLDERNNILNQAILLGYKESVRIFLAELYDAYIYNKRRVSGADLVNEYASGLANRFTLYNIKAIVNTNIPITGGVKYLSRGAFNPIGGLQDVYSVFIYYAISDPGIWRDPHSGDVIPWRENFNVIAASTTPSIDVPADAIKWDPINHKWVTVGSGLKAKSVVQYNFTFGNWHDGSPNNIYDILYGFYFLWEWSNQANATDQRYSSTYASSVGPTLQSLIAIKPSADGNSITIYLNYWHFDKGEIAAFLDPWVTTPWQLLYAMEQMYIKKQGSWYQSEANARGTVWLDPIAASQAAVIRSWLAQFNSTNSIPDALTSGWSVTGLPQITLDEAKTRYTASIKFIDTYGHALISNGLFILTQYIPNNQAVLQANRADPLDPAKWKAFTVEKLASIDNISYTAPPNVIPKGQDFVANVQISISNVGPATSDQIRNRYWVYDTSGNLLFSGNLTYTGTPGSFKIQFPTNNLETGVHSLKIYVGSIYALIPDIKQVSFIVGPSITTQTTTTTTTTTTTPGGGTSITLPFVNTTTTTTTTSPPQSPTPAPPIDILTITIIVLAILVVATLAVIFLRRPAART